MIIDGEKVPVGRPAHARRRQPRDRRGARRSCRSPTRPTSTGRSTPRSAAFGCGAMPRRSSARRCSQGAARLMRERQERDRAHRDDGGGQDPRRGAHRSHDERRPVRVLRRRMRSASTGGSWCARRHALDRACANRSGPVAAFAPWNFPHRQSGPQARRADRRRLLGDPQGGRGGAGLGAGGAAVPARCRACPRRSAQAVFGVPDEVSRHLLASPIIRKLSFTGSTVVGKHLMKLAADDMQAHHHGTRRPRPGAGVRRCRRRAGARTRWWPPSFAMPARSASRRRASSCRRTSSSASSAASPSARSRWRVGDGLEEGTQMGPMANPRRPEAMERLIGDAVPGGAHAAHRRRADRQPGLLLRARPCCPRSRSRPPS